MPNFVLSKLVSKEIPLQDVLFFQSEKLVFVLYCPSGTQGFREKLSKITDAKSFIATAEEISTEFRVGGVDGVGYILEKEKLVMATVGKGVVFIERGEKVGKILFSEEKAKFAIGQVEDDDKLLLLIGDSSLGINDSKAREIITTDNVANFTDSETLIGLVADFGDKEVTPFLSNTNTSTPETIPTQSKLPFFVGIALLVILAVSIAFGVYQKGKREKEDTLNQKIEEITTNLKNAQSLAPTSKERSKELFLLAKSELVLLSDKKESDPKIQALLDEISANESRIMGEIVVEPKLFLDLNLVSPEFNGTQMSVSEGKLVVLGGNNDRVIEVDMASKHAEVIGGQKDVAGTKALANYAGRIFLLKDKEIDELGKVKRVDGTWEGEVLLQAYSSNLYVLDKQASKILRYQSAGAGFSEGGEWLAPGITLDLTGATSFAIDGSMWLLSSNKITKLTQGVPQGFSVDEDISGATTIFTDENQKNIYVLLPEKGEVLGISKTGEETLKYKSDIFKNAVSVMASETDGAVYVLTQGKLYMFKK